MHEIQDYKLGLKIEEKKTNTAYLAGAEDAINCIRLMFWSRGKGNNGVFLNQDQVDYLDDLAEKIIEFQMEIIRNRLN